MTRTISLIAAALLIGSIAPSAQNATFSLVPNWAQLPAGWVFGHPQGFPLPAAREAARADAERARAEAIAHGETPPRRPPNLQPGVSGVAVDRDDNVYAFHRGEHPILVFDSAGRFLRSGGEGITGTVPHFIEVDDEGNVWVIDEAAHRVLKFNPELTEVLLQIGTTDEPGHDATHLDRPADVDIASTGEILIADGYGNNRIAKFAPDGSFIEEWGGGPQDESAEDGGFHLPHAVEIDQNDKVYVLDRENRRIQMFDLAGNFLGKWTHLGYAWGLAVSRDGQYAYIAEHDQEQVLQVSTATGEVLARWGRQGRGPTQFDWAHGIAVDSSGAVYVADTYGQRLQKFVPDTAAVTTQAAQSMPLMMVVGCVAQEADEWWVVSATEPVEITEEVPPEPEVGTPLGEGRLRLIGTLDEFGVRNHAGHKVRVKGLLIEDDDESRLNLTSIRHLAPACE